MYHSTSIMITMGSARAHKTPSAIDGAGQLLEFLTPGAFLHDGLAMVPARISAVAAQT